MAPAFLEGVDPRSGYSSSDGIYYSRRVPVFIPHDPNLDLITFLFAPQFGDSVALIDSSSGRTLTYGQVEHHVRVVAAGLWKTFDIRKNDVVMLLSPNSIDFPVIFLAVVWLGGIMTTVNPLNTPAEIKKQMKDSGTKFIITVPELAQKFMGVNLPMVVIGDQKIMSDLGSKSIIPYSELLLADPSKAPRVRNQQKDTAALLYSSGTTGMSKGVVLTHSNFIAASSMRNYALEEIRGPDDILLLVVPMFHVYGLAVCISQLARGIATVVMPRFDLVELLSTIEKYRVTHVPLVPPVVIALTKHDMVLKYDLSSLKQIGSGAAPQGKEIMDTCAQRFPNCILRQGYGMTELTGVGSVTPTPVEDGNHRFGSAGILIPNAEAMVVDPSTGKWLPPNKQGELWIRGPMVMKEYLNNPKETVETLDKDGWLHTGDLVYFDEDGYLFVVDRLKELIKYKAFQVAPAELEALLLSHPEILDSAVIPYPHEEAGQIPMAFIVRAPGSTLSADEVMKFVAEQVASYKKVRKVAFLEAIPKSAAGKILRRELVQLTKAKPKL